MATKPSATGDDVLKDARYIYEQTKVHLAGFKAAEKERSEKVITDAFVKDFGVDVKDLDSALKGQTVTRIAIASATNDEEAQRETVYDQMVQLRKDVNATPSASAALRTAVGIGGNWRPDSTPGLVKASGTLIEWMSDAANQVEGKKAGITAAKIATLATSRAALLSADTAQDGAKAGAKGHTLTKEDLLKIVADRTAQVRKSAESAFSGNKNVLALFHHDAAPHHTPVKRAAKPPTEPPTK